MKPQQQTTHKAIVQCVRCGQNLWTVAITPNSDHMVKSHAWTSWNPEFYTGRPNSWNCPLCLREFAEIDKHGMRHIKMIDLRTGKRMVAS